MNNHTTYEGQKSRVIWPLALIIGLVPLIVRMKVLSIPEAGKWLWDTGSGKYSDFFSANKLIVLGVLTVIGIILLFLDYNKQLVYKNKAIYICIGLYTLFAILSTLLAQKGEKSVAFFGAPGRYEGLLAIILYMIITILAMYVAQEWWNVKALYKALSIGAFVMGLIGLGQFLGWDILQTDGGKALMLPFKYLGIAGDLNFTFNSNQAYTVYGTLFHSNYVGSYAAMLMPISMVGMIYTYLYKKDKEKRFNATVFALLMAVLWFASHSRGGLVGGVFALILIFILLHNNFIKTKGQMGVFISLVIVGAIFLNIMSRGTISRQLFSLPKEIVKLFSVDEEEVPQLKDIRLQGDSIEIDSNLPTFRIEKEGEDIVLKDSQGNLIPITQKGDKIVPQDSAYTGMHIEFFSSKEFRVNIANPEKNAHYPLLFVYVGDEFPGEGYRVVGGNKELVKIEPVESWGFEGKEQVGSARGYIWSRTFPMVKDTWLLGYGPDTYALHFPQKDVIGKANAYNTPLMIVDKPHNLYLQIIVSTGLPSLLALVALFVVYFILWVKHIRSTDQDDIRRWMSIGIFAAICGYLIAGLFNDSVVSVAPVFWVLWGLGIGLTNSSTQLQVVKKAK